MKNSIFFWKWFTNNQGSLKNLYTQEPHRRILILNDLQDLLHYTSLNLDFAIVYNFYNSSTELILITCENHQAFQAANKLIDAAPKLEGWIFTLQNLYKYEIETTLDNLDECFVFGEITLKTDNYSCRPINTHNSPKEKLFIYYKSHQVYCQKQNLKQALFLIINKSIENENCHKCLNYVQLAQNINSTKNYTELYDFDYYLKKIK